MTSWAKNQIAKQLARFVKNLEPSQISLKFLKGEGELFNLELNEKVLTDLLELPPWLQLKKATCNRICAKIHWTSLKTDPIRLFLDCVEVEIEASEHVVAKSHIPAQFKQSSKEKQHAPKTSKYGFAEKVVDGMFVSMNSVLVSFKASGFKASFSMSRFIVQSTDQYWNVPNNLRKTRIKDEQRGQVLIFKELKWGTMRLDADAAYAEATEQGSIPIRLITNNSAIRLTIKKRLNDCSLVSSRLEILLDDILWILTQSQLLKLSSFVHYILRIRQKFLPMATHSEVPKDHKPISSSPNSQDASQFQGQGYGSTLNKLFTEHDVVETSYHVKTNRIDLHLCDDQTLSGSSSSNKMPKTESNEPKDECGALLISIHKFKLDHYPYHIAGLKRKLERNDDDALFARRQWAQQLFDFFLRNEGKQINQIASILSKTSGAYRRPMMYESFFLISCSKFAIMQVSTNDRQEPKPFLSSDKDSLFLPEDMNSFLLDFTSYYFIGYQNLPVPPSNMYLKLNPVKLTFHPLTCIWLNKFILSVVAGFEWTKEFMSKETGPPEHLDMRIECLMPQVTVPCETDSNLPHQEERPKALQVQISQAVISNSRIGTATSQSDLLMDVQNALASKVYSTNNAFPNAGVDCGPLPNDYWVNDYSILHNHFLTAYRKQRAASFEKHQTELGASSQDKRAEKSPSKDTAAIPRMIWCFWCEQIWIDFIGIEKSYGRPVTLIDAVPLRLWLSFPVIVQKSALVESDSGFVGSKDSPVSLNGATFEGGSIGTLNEPIQRSLIKTGSTSSLPATLHSNTIISSPSNASLSSSTSIESSASTQDSLTGSNQRIYYHKNANKHGINQIATPASSNQFHPTSLRTSYSETDLLPIAVDEFDSESSSLQDLSSEEVTTCVAGPPPPYSLSQSHGARQEGTSNVTSNDSLPPTYSQLPSYQSALKEEHEVEAAPLPSKMPKDVLDYFVVRDKDNKDGRIDPIKAKRLPTIGSILQVTKETNIQLDHFQLVFLMRLQEMFAVVASRISEDTMQFQTQESPVHKETQEISCLTLQLSVPSLNINIILPPLQVVPEEQFLSLEDRIVSGKLTRFYQILEAKRKSEKLEKDGEEVRHNSSDSDSGAITQSEESCSSSDKSTANSPSKASNEGLHNLYASNVLEKTQLQNEITKEENESEMLADESKFSDLKSSSISSACKNDVMKERLSTEGNGMKFDVPVNPADHVIITDDSDEERIASEDGDILKESNLMDVRESESKLRRALQEVETCETGVQTDNDLLEENGYERFRDNEVSVVCLKCINVRLGVESEGQSSVLKVVIDGIKLKEKGNVTYGMTLDHRLAADKSTEKEDFVVCASKPQIRMRIISGPAAKEHGHDAVEMGFAHCKVSDLAARLHLSTAENLSEFIEDECLAKKMPFKVELDNINLKLIDDKARRYLSSLLPPPMEVNIGKLSVNIGADGKITLCDKKSGDLFSTNGSVPNMEDAVDVYEESLINDLTIGENKDRMKQEAVLENERLVDDLKLANARLVSLEQERDAILRVVEKLQQELMWSNHENDKLVEKLRNYKLYIRDLNRK